MLAGFLGFVGIILVICYFAVKDSKDTGSSQGKRVNFNFSKKEVREDREYRPRPSGEYHSAGDYREEKGKEGEDKVIEKLSEIDEVQYIVNDINVYLDNGKHSQIDHVLINRDGIFVIETKNWAGRITGSIDDLYISQEIENGKSFDRYNPVKQNRNHIYNLNKKLNINVPMKSVVCFTNPSCTVDIKGSSETLYINELNNRVRAKENRISIDEVNRIYDKLLEIKYAG